MTAGQHSNSSPCLKRLTADEQQYPGAQVAPPALGPHGPSMLLLSWRLEKPFAFKVPEEACRGATGPKASLFTPGPIPQIFGTPRAPCAETKGIANEEAIRASEKRMITIAFTQYRFVNNNN